MCHILQSFLYYTRFSIPEQFHAAGSPSDRRTNEGRCQAHSVVWNGVRIGPFLRHRPDYAVRHRRRVPINPQDRRSVWLRRYPVFYEFPMPLTRDPSLRATVPVWRVERNRRAMRRSIATSSGLRQGSARATLLGMRDWRAEAQRRVSRVDSQQCAALATLSPMCYTHAWIV